MRPTGPWRFGPDSGARDRVDLHLHSDAVYSAVTSAMAQLGTLGRVAGATPRETNPTRRRCVSAPCFRFTSETLFVVPPRNLWPPPASIKMRYKGARFAPLAVVEALLNDKPIEEDRWQVDGESACLIPAGWPAGPFRTGMRSNAGVDRLDQGSIQVHVTACLEFTRDSGLWLAVTFAAMRRGRSGSRGCGARSGCWPIAGWAASGRAVGAGRRSRAGINPMRCCSRPLWTEAETGLLAALGVCGRRTRTRSIGSAGQLLDRHPVRPHRKRQPLGRAQAAHAMVAEGSVLVAAQQPRGMVRDVAPEGFPHPVYRSGFALTIPIPWRVPA